MASRCAFVAVFVMAMLQGAWTATFQIKADTGVVLLWQAQTGFWSAMKDSLQIGTTDSLYVDDKYNATLRMGKGTSVLLKGECRMCLKASDTNAVVYLDQGQVFLKRDEGAELSSVKIVAMGCSFMPLGTAAAIKLTKTGEPSVAVLRGKVRMESPAGEPIVVEQGSFGTFSPASKTIKQGKIPSDAIAFLEKWSGQQQEQPTLASNSEIAAKPDSAKLGVPPSAAPASEATSHDAPVSQPPPQPPAEAEKKDEQATTPAAATPETEAVKAEKSKEQQPESTKETASPTGASQGVSWQVDVGSVTVEGKQWTRIAISPDIPIWKFGLGLDIECFLDDSGRFSDKSWEFDKNTWYKSIARKIKYIRYGHENDRLFLKFGGLSNVTLGYGFIVDRFTNLLHYPDQKLLGVQCYLNDIGPMGLTLQAMVPDIMEFKGYHGGIITGRLAITPLKKMNMPLISSLSIGATYATDLNEFAPARDWRWNGVIWDKNENHKADIDYAFHQARNASDSNAIRQLAAIGLIDPLRTQYPIIDTTYRDSTRLYAILGGDIGMPIIKTSFMKLDVYGQGAVVADSNMFNGKRTGWGFGAPGVRLNVGPFFGQLEYRHIHGKFVPGYFSPYYFDERLLRKPSPAVKSDSLPSVDLDGIFGTIGANIMNLVFIDGSYQYMGGSYDKLDQRFEARGRIGDAILKKIPKINKAELYIYKTNINRTIVVYDSLGRPIMNRQTKKPYYDEFFEQTPNLYWGYRIGVEISKGASLVWDTRYSYQWKVNGRYYKLVPYNNMIIGMAFTF